MSGGAAPEIGLRVRASGSDLVRQELAQISRDAEDAFARVGTSASGTSERVTSVVSQAQGAVGGVSSTVTGLLGKLKGAGDAIANAFSFGFGKVIELSGQFGAATGVVGAGITGLVYATRSYTQSVAESVSATGDLADQLALPIDQLTRLQAAFRVNGGDGEKIGAGLTTLKSKVVQLAEGNQAAIDSFSELGLSMSNLRDGKGDLLGTRQLLDLVLDRIKKIENPTLRAKAVMDLFGQSASALGELATKGSAGLRDAEKDVARYGTVVDAATKEALDEGLAGQAKLAESLRGLGMSLARTFFPFFAESSEGLSKWLNDNREKIEGWLKGLKGIAEAVKQDFVSLFGIVSGTPSGGRRSGNRGSTDDDDDDDEGPAAPAAKGEKTVRRLAMVNGRMVDLDKLRINSAGKVTDAERTEQEKRAQGGEQEISTAADQSVRYAEINGKRVALSVRRSEDEMRKIGGGFNYPIFGVLANVVSGIRDGVASLIGYLSNKALSDFVGLIGSLANLASQAGRAVLSLGNFIAVGLGSVTGVGPAFSSLIDGIATRFREFSRGLSRGFKLPWAEDLRRAALNVLVSLQGLGPWISSIGGALVGFAGQAASWVRTFTESLLGIPAQVGNATKVGYSGAIEGAKSPLDGFIKWLGEAGVRIGEVLNKNHALIVLPILALVSGIQSGAGWFATTLGTLVGAAIAFGPALSTSLGGSFAEAERTVVPKANSLVHKASLPGVAIGKMPTTAAIGFLGSWGPLGAALAGAAEAVLVFGLRIAETMKNVGVNLGLFKPGTSTGVAAGVLAFAAQLLVASGALDVLRGVLLTATVALAAVFYSLLIATVGLKFFVEAILLGTKAFAVMFTATNFVLQAMVVTFTTAYGLIRAATLAFWAFMALSPFTMIIGIGVIVTAAAVAVVMILRHFGGIQVGWDLITRSLVATWHGAIDAIGATGEFLTDIWEHGFIETLGQLFTDLWHGFVNGGIWAWNQVKHYTGLERLIGRTNYYGSDEEIQKQYNDQLKRLGLADGEGRPTRRETVLPGMPQAPTRTIVKDPASYAGANDIITGADGVQRPKSEEIKRLQDEADRKYQVEKTAYEKDKTKFLRRHAAEREAAAGDGDAPGGAATPGWLETLKRQLIGDGAGGGIGEGIGEAVRKMIGGGTPGAAGGATPGTGIGEGIGEAVRKMIGGGGADDGGLGEWIKKLNENADKRAADPTQAPEGDRKMISPEMRRLMELLRQQGTTDASKDNDPYKVFRHQGEDDGTAPVERRAGFDPSELTKRFAGLGTGLDGGTDFTQGVPDPVILDPRDRPPPKEEVDVGADNGGIRRVALSIEPGDKALYGTDEAVEALVKQLADLGLRVRTDSQRAT